MIDRFDVRAHLDIIPGNGGFSGSNVEAEVVSGLSKKQARQYNYERYRILVQNDFLKGKCLLFSPPLVQCRTQGCRCMSKSFLHTFVPTKVSILSVHLSFDKTSCGVEGYSGILGELS